MTNLSTCPHLFLDFDGVLHPTSAGRGRLFMQVELLGEALQSSDCCIVISSSWRHHFPLDELLDRFPPGLKQRIVGATGESIIGRWPRHQEILAYLKARKANAPWRALDDSWNEFPPHCPELIVCDPNTGLEALQVVAVRAWLDSLQRA